MSKEDTERLRNERSAGFIRYNGFRDCPSRESLLPESMSPFEHHLSFANIAKGPRFDFAPRSTNVTFGQFDRHKRTVGLSNEAAIRLVLEGRNPQLGRFIPKKRNVGSRPKN